MSGCAAQRLADKRRYDASIAQAHPRTVSVEDPNDSGIDVVIAVIRHRHRLREPFRLVVNAARPDRVHVAPVVFFLRMLERIAVHFRRRSKNERGLFVLRQTKGVVRAERAHFQRGNREFQIIDRTRRRREMKDVIDLLFWQKDEVRDVMFDEPEILVASEMSNVRRVAGDLDCRWR